VNTTTAVVILILVFLWLVLLVLTFRSPGAPRVTRLIFFQFLLVVTVVLGYFFLVYVLHYNPNPVRVRLARTLTKDRMIYLGDFVPGLTDLDFIHRIDTDQVEEEIKEEWVAFYQYDITGQWQDNYFGPFGGSIYDHDYCRAPAISAYELVPLSYDYLAQTSIYVDESNPANSDVIVENAIQYKEDCSYGELRGEEGVDYPEVFIYGRTQGVRTDLNVFRKAGLDLTCIDRQQWEDTHPGEPLPCEIHYENIGSFRGNYRVAANGARVNVYDRAPFERSQFVVKSVYVPDSATGSYLRSSGQIAGELALVPPVEVSVEFGPGPPEDTLDVYYPEKTVLAFFLQLAQDPDEAMTYVCGDNKGRRDYHPEDFGLQYALRDLERIIVCEIRYSPDVAAEQNHETRLIGVKVVEVTEGGSASCENAQEIECAVAAQVSPGALPYNCEWCLLGCVPK